MVLGKAWGGKDGWFRMPPAMELVWNSKWVFSEINKAWHPQKNQQRRTCRGIVLRTWLFPVAIISDPIVQATLQSMPTSEAYLRKMHVVWRLRSSTCCLWGLGNTGQHLKASSSFRASFTIRLRYAWHIARHTPCSTSGIFYVYYSFYHSFSSYLVRHWFY